MWAHIYKKQNIPHLTSAQEHYFWLWSLINWVDQMQIDRKPTPPPQEPCSQDTWPVLQTNARSCLNPRIILRSPNLEVGFKWSFPRKASSPLLLSKKSLGEWRIKAGVPVGRITIQSSLLCQGSKSCSSGPGGHRHCSWLLTIAMVCWLNLSLPFPSGISNCTPGPWWLLLLGRRVGKGSKDLYQHVNIYSIFVVVS